MGWSKTSVAGSRQPRGRGQPVAQLHRGQGIKAQILECPVRVDAPGRRVAEHGGRMCARPAPGRSRALRFGQPGQYAGPAAGRALLRRRRAARHGRATQRAGRRAVLGLVRSAAWSSVAGTSSGGGAGEGGVEERQASAAGRGVMPVRRRRARSVRVRWPVMALVLAHSPQAREVAGWWWAVRWWARASR